VAESCTGGWIAKRITDRARVSSFFLGGIVAYANEVKTAQLGVEPDLLARTGAVSEDVAIAMAMGVRERMGADASIAITGIAGPGGGSAEKPVGTVWYAASVGDRYRATHRRFPGNREAVRMRSAQAALNLLYRMLGSEDEAW
jgi:PncC family amidohydrolase